MNSFENQIEVTRGRDWTFDKFVTNKDDSPFIVSAEFANPYLLMTISSAIYSQEQKYLRREWLDMKSSVSGTNDLPRFYETKPVAIQDKNSLNATTGAVLGLDGKSYPFAPDGRTYEGGQRNALFYYVDVDGKHYVYVNRLAPSTYIWNENEYALRIIIPFPRYVTKEWTGKEYVYSLDIIDGDIAPDADTTGIPIINTTAYSILTPTKMIINSDIRGGLQ